MPRIAVTASNRESAKPYLDAVERQGGQTLLLLPAETPPVREVLAQVQGLLFTGGADVDPHVYGEERDPTAGLETNSARDAMELPLMKSALEQDLPVLCICRGMQLLNVALGGRLIQDLPGHKAEESNGEWVSARHHIWISPGSKLAAAIGSGGRVRVNSRHHQGLREAQKSSQLVASAYSIEDFLVEGVESPRHRWVVGVQFHPERQEEVPKQFQRLFERLVVKAGP